MSYGPQTYTNDPDDVSTSAMEEEAEELQDLPPPKPRRPSHTETRYQSRSTSGSQRNRQTRFAEMESRPNSNSPSNAMQRYQTRQVSTKFDQDTGQMQQETSMTDRQVHQDDNGLKLRLDLNVDIELELKAKIHGDLTLALM
ncbi:uncharacterized protein BDV14DRAFT_204630 [Aspergillus stella-maris]|uniref:uncharacterized protein n=1 Tax=Aspergillus stella-maris TaxID=1810926 RepID=UPI003CCD1DAB